MTAKTADILQFVSVRFSMSKKSGFPTLNTEVIPGWVQKTTHPGRLRRTGDKWEYRGRTFNTPEGAAIYALMNNEL